jgi:hypothetical protein
MMTKVFIIPFHVKAMDESIMPSDLGGAYVSCYCQGDTYVEATKSALKKLSEDGLYPEEILQPINEMDSGFWSEHLNETWPEHIDILPSQAEFEEAINAGQVVYGPFGSYNPP